MKEIKFRCWDNLDKTMDSAENITYIENNRPSEFNEFVFMQYTGLKDKNGVEIYESDIVKNNQGKISKINFIEDYAKYEAFDEDLSWVVSDTFEVIGNIYENKELLN